MLNSRCPSLDQIRGRRLGRIILMAVIVCTSTRGRAHKMHQLLQAVSSTIEETPVFVLICYATPNNPGMSLARLCISAIWAASSPGKPVVDSGVYGCMVGRALGAVVG